MSIQIKLSVYRRLDNRFEGLTDDSPRALELHNRRKAALHHVLDNSEGIEVIDWGMTDDSKPHELVEISIVASSAPSTPTMTSSGRYVAFELSKKALDKVSSEQVGSLTSKLILKQATRQILDFDISLPDGTRIHCDPPDRRAEITIRFADGTTASQPMDDRPFYKAAMTKAKPPMDEAQPSDERWNLAGEYRVWFGTNRWPIDPVDTGKGFTNERDPDGKVHYGTCSVEIPRTHKFGSLGTPFWSRWIRLEFTDDHLKLKQIVPLTSESDFLGSLRKELESQDEADRVVLVYLHGYNTSFKEAALRTAQIGFDLKIPGATAFYSWPSMDNVAGYFGDIARVEASEKQMADFLAGVANKAGAKRVHIIAHSMGNRGFARAVSRITAYAEATGKVSFGQIILAAPDIDVDLFKQLAIAYPKISERTTMYVSAKDKALGMSSFLQDSDRAGFTPPVTVLKGIDTVEVTDIDLTLLGHGYFAEAEAVLYDMKELIDNNKRPENRVRIEPKIEGSAKFWAIRP